MSFDMEPDHNEHAECRREIKQLQAEVSLLRTFAEECCEYAERNGYVADGSITSLGKYQFGIYAMYCRAREVLAMTGANEFRSLKADAARWRWIRNYLLAADVGDDCFAWGLVIEYENLEFAVGVTNFKQSVEQMIDAAIQDEADGIVSSPY